MHDVVLFVLGFPNQLRYYVVSINKETKNPQKQLGEAFNCTQKLSTLSVINL